MKLFEQMDLTKKSSCPLYLSGDSHVYNQFVVRTARRDELRQFLTERGIPSEIYYPYPLHLQPAFLIWITSRAIFLRLKRLAAKCWRFQFLRQFLMNSNNVWSGQSPLFTADQSFLIFSGIPHLRFFLTIQTPLKQSLIAIYWAAIVDSVR